MINKKERENFFKDVTGRCKYSNLENTKDIYYAIVRTFLDDVRIKDKAVLPYIGEFNVRSKKQMIKDLHTGIRRQVEIVRMSFSSVDRLKKMINKKKKG